MVNRPEQYKNVTFYVDESDSANLSPKYKFSNILVQSIAMERIYNIAKRDGESSYYLINHGRVAVPRKIPFVAHKCYLKDILLDYTNNNITNLNGYVYLQYSTNLIYGNIVGLEINITDTMSHLTGAIIFMPRNVEISTMENNIPDPSVNYELDSKLIILNVEDDIDLRMTDMSIVLSEKYQRVDQDSNFISYGSNPVEINANMVLVGTPEERNNVYAKFVERVDKDMSVTIRLDSYVCYANVLQINRNINAHNKNYDVVSASMIGSLALNELIGDFNPSGNIA